VPARSSSSAAGVVRIGCVRGVPAGVVGDAHDGGEHFVGQVGRRAAGRGWCRTPACPGAHVPATAGRVEAPVLRCVAHRPRPAPAHRPAPHGRRPPAPHRVVGRNRICEAPRPTSRASIRLSTEERASELQFYKITVTEEWSLEHSVIGRSRPPGQRVHQQALRATISLGAIGAVPARARRRPASPEARSTADPPMSGGIGGTTTWLPRASVDDRFGRRAA